MSSDFDKFKSVELDMSKVKFELPKFSIPSYSPPDIEKMMAPVRMAQQDKVDREMKTVELLENLLKTAQTRPEAIPQHIQTLIQNSGVIENIQNVYSSNNVNQIITNNTGMKAEEFLQLIASIKEVSSLLNEKLSNEADEVITQLEEEITKEDRKPGVIKASLSYLRNLFTETVANPAKDLAKEQFGSYMKEKLPDIFQGIDHILKSLG